MSIKKRDKDTVFSKIREMFCLFFATFALMIYVVNERMVKHEIEVQYQV